MNLPSSQRFASINLPHAHTIVGRIVGCVEAQQKRPAEETTLPELLAELDRLLRPYPEDPPEATAIEVADIAAAIARRLVEEIEKVGYRDDRLGQCIRNLFECLGLAEQGADLSLRCGERPDSPLRP